MPPPFGPHYGPPPHRFRFPETPLQRTLKYIALIIFGLVFIVGILVAIFKSPSGDKASKDKPSDAKKPADNANAQPTK